MRHKKNFENFENKFIKPNKSNDIMKEQGKRQLEAEERFKKYGEKHGYGELQQVKVGQTYEYVQYSNRVEIFKPLVTKQRLEELKLSETELLKMHLFPGKLNFGRLHYTSFHPNEKGTLVRTFDQGVINTNSEGFQEYKPKEVLLSEAEKEFKQRNKLGTGELKLRLEPTGIRGTFANGVEMFEPLVKRREGQVSSPREVKLGKCLSEIEDSAVTCKFYNDAMVLVDKQGFQTYVPEKVLVSEAAPIFEQEGKKWNLGKPEKVWLEQTGIYATFGDNIEAFKPLVRQEKSILEAQFGEVYAETPYFGEEGNRRGTKVKQYKDGIVLDNKKLQFYVPNEFKDKVFWHQNTETNDQIDPLVSARSEVARLEAKLKRQSRKSEEQSKEQISRIKQQQSIIDRQIKELQSMENVNTELRSKSKENEGTRRYLETQCESLLNENKQKDKIISEKDEALVKISKELTKSKKQYDSLVSEHVKTQQELEDSKDELVRSRSEARRIHDSKSNREEGLEEQIANLQKELEQSRSDNKKKDKQIEQMNSKAARIDKEFFEMRDRLEELEPLREMFVNNQARGEAIGENLEIELLPNRIKQSEIAISQRENESAALSREEIRAKMEATLRILKLGKPS